MEDGEPRGSLARDFYSTQSRQQKVIKINTMPSADGKIIYIYIYKAPLLTYNKLALFGFEGLCADSDKGKKSQKCEGFP